MEGYLVDREKEKCYGCEACVQICPKDALVMKEDDEGFRYPLLDKERCIECNLCRQVCPYENMPKRYSSNKYMNKLSLKAQAAVHFQLLSILFAMKTM